MSTRDATQITQNCATCRDLRVDEWLDSSDNATSDITLGTARAYMLTQENCKVCSFIASAFRLQYEGSSSPDQHINKWLTLRRHRNAPWYNILGLESDAQSCEYLTIESSQIENDDSRVCIYRSTDANVMPRQLVSTQHNPEQLDIALIKQWLRACRHHHGPQVCPRRQWSNWDELGSNGSIFLIDVETRSVIRALPGHRYLALSYVWGESRHQAAGDWQWHTTNYAPDSSAFSIALPRTMPQTVEDALKLTDALGERYIWIDFYCINQQDPEHVESQIKRMSTIYKCAEMTIVAFDGIDAESGIAGISRPLWQKRQPILETSTGTLVATHLQAPADEAGSSEWDRRAWTMQEYVLSDRCLVLARNTTTWKCKAQRLHDCLPSPSHPDKYLFSKKTDVWWDTCDSVDLDAEEPLFARYSDFLAVYSARLIRYQADASRACQGILHQLSTTTGAKWRHGLPTEYMPAALSWTSHYSNYRKRRKEFPSWSWLGWQGRSEYTYWLHDAESFLLPPMTTQEPSGHNQRNDRAREEQPHAKRRRLNGLDVSSNRAHTLPTAQWACNETELWITSYVAEFKATLVRPNRAIRVHADGLQRSRAEGDQWSLLDSTGVIMKDPLGEHQVFEMTDYLFRLDPDISQMVRENECEVSLLFLKHYATIRDSEQAGNQAKDIITALVLVPRLGDKFERIATVAMPVRAFMRARPVEETIKIV